MSETVNLWLEKLFNDEISEAKATIKNEHIWELGYNGEAPNPHTENIVTLSQYIDKLEELKLQALTTK